MDWRETAAVPEDANPDPAVMDSIAGKIPAGQRVLLACRTRRFEMAALSYGSATVVLTGQTLIVAKDRTFGRPRPDIVIPLGEIVGSGFGPLLGVGPTWEVTFDRKRGIGASMYFAGPTPARQVEGELRAAVSNVLAEAADPDLAQLHRSLAAGQARPPGDIGKTLTPAQITDESRRMRQQVAAGDLGSAWDRRVQLGYGVPSDGVSQPDRFWLDAAPAIAALRLGGLKDHPMVAMCCGMADSNQDRGDPEQRAAVAEFTRLFHG